MRETRDFFDRLDWVLGERKLYPWGLALGFSSATLARIKRGQSPKGETLAMIARAENCCVSWLLTGQGHPFLVHRTDTDAATAERLEAYLSDESWRVDLAHDTRQAVAVLTLPAQVGEDEAAVHYTAMELIAGPIGPISAAVLSPRVHRTVRVESDWLREAQQGLVGTWRAVRRMGEGENHDGLRVADLAAQYGGGATTADEQALVEKYRQLGPTDRTHAQAVIGALAYAGHLQTGVKG